MTDLVQPFWKPIHWTSFDVIRKVRAATGIQKVGHAGSLDPFAEGVLVLCLGAATKRVSKLMDLEKEYVARVRLGQTTDTLDPTGKVTQTASIPTLSEEVIRSALRGFVGVVEQVPPMFSALKVQGQRLYRLARAGKTVPREARTVRIYGIDLVAWHPPHTLELQVTCGKGTYIRTLGADIARALNTVGYLTHLTRIRVGHYGSAEAVRMDRLASWIPTAA